MQEHFNENYVESDKYPNATFKGKVSNIGDIDFTKDGEYQVQVEGELTMHGISNKIKEAGTFIVKGDEVSGKSTFIIKPEEYEIEIPKTVMDNIAEEIEVTVLVSLKEFKK